MLLSEALMVPGIFLLLYLTMLIHERFSFNRLLTLSLVTSALVYTRVNLGVLLAVAVVAIYRGHVTTVPKAVRFKRVVWYLCLVFVLLLPWSIRNTLLNRHLSFVSCNGPVNLFEGNNPLAQGTNIPRFSQFKDIYQPPQRAQGESHFSYFQRQGEEARRFLLEHMPYQLFTCLPNRLAALLTLRFYRVPYYETAKPGIFAEHPFGPYFFVPLFDWNVIGALALFSILTRNRRGYWLLLLGAVLTVLPYAVLHVNPRYRFPLDPFAIIAAGVVLAYLMGKRFVPIWRTGVITLVVVVILGAAINKARFGGRNLLMDENLCSLTSEGQAAVESELTLTEKNLNLAIGEIKIDPRKVSHL